MRKGILTFLCISVKCQDRKKTSYGMEEYVVDPIGTPEVMPQFIGEGEGSCMQGKG